MNRPARRLATLAFAMTTSCGARTAVESTTDEAADAIADEYCSQFIELDDCESPDARSKGCKYLTPHCGDWAMLPAYACYRAIEIGSTAPMPDCGCASGHTCQIVMTGEIRAGGIASSECPRFAVCLP